MKILLFGEYNRSHKFLKDGLIACGQEAIVVGRKDGFKDVDVDISLDINYFKKKFPDYLRRIVIKLLSFDLADIEIVFRFYKHRKKLKNHDIVQLINTFPLEIHPFLEKQCLKFLFKHNTHVFLSACGDDCVYVDYLMGSNLDYHLMTPYQKNKGLAKYYEFNLKFLQIKQKKLSDYVFSNIKGVTPSDFDYVMAYRNHPKSMGLIPHSINLANFDYQDLNTKGKIVIFHGINRGNYYRKGNFYFENALALLKEKYGNVIEIITVENKAYNHYITLLKKAHILLDQVYSYDQGYNALEAMAQGKVVFTGAEKEWLAHYNLKENTVAINALPDAKYIAQMLEWLILNPEKITEISKNARDFVAREHNHIMCAQHYLNNWTTITAP